MTRALVCGWAARTMVTTASGHGSVQVLIVIIIIIVISVIIIIIIIIIILGELIGWYDWGPGQPQPGRDQHCLYVVGGWLGYQWADFHCDFQVIHPSNMPFELLHGEGVEVRPCIHFLPPSIHISQFCTF